MSDNQTLPNRIAFAATAASAFIQAVQQALKDAPGVVASPIVPDLNQGAWNYLPLALVCTAVAAWICGRLMPVRTWSAISPEAALSPTLPDSGPGEPLHQHAPAPPIFLPAAFSQTMAELYKRQHTGAERAVLLRPHQGKWVRLDGFLSHVSDISFGSMTVFIDIAGQEHPNAGVMISFPESQETFLASIRLGAPISVIAQISDDNPPRLVNGELA